MSTTPRRTTRGTPRPSVTEEDIQAQLHSGKSTMARQPQSPIFDSSSEPSNNDDPMDLSYPLPTLPLSSIQAANINNELSLTRDQSDLLHSTMRNSMREHGVLGTLDFRNHAEAEQALKPVLKDVKGQLSFLERNARQKGGPGMERLMELLTARARLVEGAEHRKTRKASQHVETVQDEAGGEESGNEDGGHRDDMSVTAALGGLNVQDAAAANSVPALTPIRTRAHAPVTPPFCPTSFIVRVEGSSVGAAVLASQLTATVHSESPISVEQLQLNKFLELVSDQVSFNVQGRIFAIVGKALRRSTYQLKDPYGHRGQVARGPEVLADNQEESMRVRGQRVGG